MSASAQYAATPVAINASIATSKTNDRANGTSANLVSLSASGAGRRIDELQFTAQGTTTTATSVLLYKGADAASAVYFDEVPISAITVGNTTAAATARFLGPVILASTEALFGAFTVSPGIAVNCVSRMVGSF